MGGTKNPRYRKRPAKRNEFDRIDTDVHNTTIEGLCDFLSVLDAFLDPSQRIWYRGHSDFSWKLSPAALRPDKEEDRKRLLDQLPEFQRLAERKIDRALPSDDRLKWMQYAQHYGLPTRLLDWTQNPLIALYFACLDNGEETHGAVFMLSPETLNRTVAANPPRIFDAIHDRGIIDPYLKLPPRQLTRGITTIAINPTWSSERIVLQQGVFTLHGSKSFALTRKEAGFLTCLPIRKYHKKQIRRELERIGVDESTIFPEPEHLCNQLRRRAVESYR